MKISIFLLTAILINVATIQLHSQNKPAKIKIDLEREIGEISPLLYGNFIQCL